MKSSFFIAAFFWVIFFCLYQQSMQVKTLKKERKRKQQHQQMIWKRSWLPFNLIGVVGIRIGAVRVGMGGISGSDGSVGLVTSDGSDLTSVTITLGIVVLVVDSLLLDGGLIGLLLFSLLLSSDETIWVGSGSGEMVARVPAGVVAVRAEVLLSGLLILVLSENAGSEGNQNKKALHHTNITKIESN